MCNTCPVKYTPDLLDESKVIILPYYREINNYLPSPVARANYTPYHLFCLKKNIMSLIRRMDPEYDITFSSKKHDDVMIVTIQIYKGGIVINPDNMVYNKITDNLQSYIDLYPYCLVYSLSDCIKKYNSLWSSDILSYIANKTHTMYNRSDIFINLEDVPNHGARWQEVYNRINELLSDYYHRGVIYRPDAKLVENWNLKRIDIDLYEADWVYNFTYDKIEFLYSEHKRLSIYLGKNDKIVTKDGWLTIAVSSYDQVDNLMSELF